MSFDGVAVVETEAINAVINRLRASALSQVRQLDARRSDSRCDETRYGGRGRDELGGPQAQGQRW
jgi:hypothetical protein